MLFANLRIWYSSRTHWEQAALLTWCAILLFVSVRAFVAPTSKTVYPIFGASGRFWWTGTELYEPGRPTNVQDGWRYSPGCAILFTPFAIFPDSIGGVLWRLFSVAALFAGLAWVARSILPVNLSRDAYAVMLLLVIPLSVQSINNGQANLVVIAAMLGAVAAVGECRWNAAAVLIGLAFVFKLYPLALGMLLILLYPRQLGWRIPAACVAGMLAPFLFQHPVYVFNQYTAWIVILRAEDRTAIPLEHMYRDLWLLIHVYGVPISRSVYPLIQLAGGVLVAVLCWRRQRAGWDTPSLLTSTLALTTAWMMLLGPATESSSFALLAPSFAWSLVEAARERERSARHGLLWCSAALFFVAVVVGGIVKEWGIHEAGVHAWGSLFYFAYAVTKPRPMAVGVEVGACDRALAA